MSNRLRTVTDWAERAQQANYCVATLASLSGVSVSTLSRHFLEAMGMTPREWLHDQRMKRTRELLVDGTCVKETAILLGYRHGSHFTKDFRQHHGYPPRQYVQRVLKATACP